MATIALTKDNFETTVANNDIVVVDFWASWCGPCRTFKPVFEKAAATHTDIAFASCDTEAESELAAGFGIRSIPTVMVFREKVLLYSQPGALPADALEDLIAQVRALDMAKVHEQVARQQQEREQAAVNG